MANHEEVAQASLDRLAPRDDEVQGERTWRFSRRMAGTYLEQMRALDDDPDARCWRELYSVDSMPPPDDTRNKAEVAAQMAFYLPTHFYKFQKAIAQQLLEWHFRQAQVNPYPFGMPSIAALRTTTHAPVPSFAPISLPL